MIVTFVHHSCFVVEMNERVLIFDYFRDGRVKGYQFTGVLPEFDSEKPVYVFASHFHQDPINMKSINCRIMRLTLPLSHWIQGRKNMPGKDFCILWNM